MLLDGSGIGQASAAVLAVLRSIYPHAQTGSFQ